MNAEQQLQSAREGFRRDLARLSFNGAIVTGGLGLVSIDLAKAKMMVFERSMSARPGMHGSVREGIKASKAQRLRPGYLERYHGNPLGSLSISGSRKLRSKTPIQLDSITTLCQKRPNCSKKLPSRIDKAIGQNASRAGFRSMSGQFKSGH